MLRNIIVILSLISFAISVRVESDKEASKDNPYVLDIEYDGNRTNDYNKYNVATEATEVETTTHYVVEATATKDKGNEKNRSGLNSMYNFFVQKVMNNGYNLTNGTVVRGYYSTHVVYVPDNTTVATKSTNNGFSTNNETVEYNEGANNDIEIFSNNENINTIRSEKMVMPKPRDDSVGNNGNYVSDNGNANNEIHVNGNRDKNNDGSSEEIETSTIINKACAICSLIGCPENHVWTGTNCIQYDEY